MNKLKLIYFGTCPNAKRARAHLILSEQPFEEINQDKLAHGELMRSYSSPSILLGETLLFGSVVGDGGGCTLEIPSSEEIISRIKEVSPSSLKHPNIFASSGSLGSILTIILCPVCKPALAAFLGTLGLGFFNQTGVMQSILILFLIVSIGGFFLSYLKIHNNIMPFLISLMMAISIYLGRYVYFGSTENNILTYGGIIGLILISIWNFTLKKPSSCKACIN
jgi:hypothetical protein